MSTLETTYYYSIPIRYAVGRWYDLPPATLLAYNAADLGLNILEYRIMNYCYKRKWNFIPEHLVFPVLLASKIVYCLAAVYVTSKLTKPMPLKAAELTSFASVVPTIVAVIIFTASQGKKT